MRDSRDDEDDSEYHDSRQRPRPAPSVIFKTEPDQWLRALFVVAVGFLGFISYQAYIGNRETGEIGVALRAYQESNDRRVEAAERRLELAESMIQRILLDGR